MIMQARHHLYGSGCVPHVLTMTRRWGPVGFMRIGGMGLGAVAPSPVGFADFNAYQAAVIASQPACPPPYDPSCENPRDAAISNAEAQWTLNPKSCHNVVCDAFGNPLVTPAPGGNGSGYNTTAGFVPVSSTAGGSFRSGSLFKGIVQPPKGKRPVPLPAPPGQPNVVNPSPSSQLTTTGSTSTAPGSVVSQTNGTVVTTGQLASTVGGTVSTTTDTTTDVIAGVPNWVLFVAGGLLIFLLAKVK